MKLEKVEIGGIRGKALTSNIGKVYEEFKVKQLYFLLRDQGNMGELNGPSGGEAVGGQHLGRRSPGGDGGEEGRHDSF